MGSVTYRFFTLLLLIGTGMCQTDNSTVPSPTESVTTSTFTDATVPSQSSSNSTVSSTTITVPTTHAPTLPIVNTFNETCFLAKLGLSFVLKNETINFPGVPNLMFSVDCNKTSKLTPSFNFTDSKTKSNYLLTLTFSNKTNQYKLEKASLVINGLTFSNNDVTSFVKTDLGKAYKCYKQEDLILKNTNGTTGNLKFKELQLQVFKVSNGQFGTVTECEADAGNKTSNIVPIVVGAVLAGLIIIVLIAYLIGRRRSRQGYESV